MLQMRQNNLLLLLLSAVLFSTGFFITSCNQNDDISPKPEPDADYTIMFYGSGGRTLDSCMMYNLQQVEGYDYTPTVQFTALVKYSSKFQNNQELTGTRLYTMTQQGMSNKKAYDSDYRLDNPDHIAAFIKESMQRLPAKKYILILWNHGAAFGYGDQPLGWSDYTTRALITDDNCQEKDGNDAIISIFELEEGLKRSGAHLDMIYWDVCLMNMIENLYQIKDYTDYVLGAAHTTPGIGGNYTYLIHALENHNKIIPAMQEYIPATVSNWKDIYATKKDLTLINMSKIDPVVQNFKKVSDEIISIKQKLVPGSEDALQFREAMQDSYMYDNDSDFMDVDLANFTKVLASSMLNGNLSAKASKLNLAIDDMIPVRQGIIQSNDNINEYSVGLFLTDKQNYEFTSDKTNGFCVIYPLLNFDKVTGWSNFLKTLDREYLYGEN